MKVLLAYDGSASAEAAIDDLERAGLPADAAIRVLTVGDVSLVPEAATFQPALVGGRRGPRPQPIAEALAYARETADEAARRIRSIQPTWTVTSEAAGGAPAWEILERAEVEDADLVVVGSHGRGSFTRLLLGSVSQRLVHHAPCSVRVVRGSRLRRMGPIHLLLALDTSVAADEVVEAVAERAWPAGTVARVVHALVPPAFPVVPLVGVPLPSLDDLAAQGRAVIERARAALSAVGLEVTADVEQGDPRRLILSEAQAYDADCIFIGARGLTRLERFLVGSVSSAVAAAAHCSVEVVR